MLLYYKTLVIDSGSFKEGEKGREGKRESVKLFTTKRTLRQESYSDTINIAFFSNIQFPMVCETGLIIPSYTMLSRHVFLGI